MCRVSRGSVGPGHIHALTAVLVSSWSRTQEALKSGHFVDVLSILLRLQRICNHPGLVEPRLPESSYAAGPLQYRLASLILRALDRDPWKVRREGLGGHLPEVCSSIAGGSGKSTPARLPLVASVPCLPLDTVHLWSHTGACTQCQRAQVFLTPCHMCPWIVRTGLWCWVGREGVE